MILWESFDKNEIAILIMNLVAYGVLFLIPKKFLREMTATFLMFGFTIGVIFDFTIGGGLIDFYKLNDYQRYELFDLVYYFLFGPFFYIFLYFYEAFHIHKKTLIWYLILWSLVGVGMQAVLNWLEVVNFQKGYKLSYSFVVFLVTQTITAIYYEALKKKVRVLAETKQE